MIVKRIRQGVRRARGSIARVVANVKALSNYVVDADPWAMAEFDRVRSLTEYALHVQQRGIEPGEKVEAFGAFNLRGSGLQTWQMEMAAIAARCPRSRDPIEHIVYSWPQHESPTAEQIEEAGAIYLEVMGFERCPAIWSKHGNTANEHGHLALVRIDPSTGRVAGDGWDIDRLHQATALIEEKQNWVCEPNALYVARGGEVFDRVTNVKVRDSHGRQVGRRGAKQLPPKVADKAIEIRQAIIAAVDWPDLHARMSEIGAAYRKKGSGAVICVEDEEAKASLVHHGCSRPHLEERLGPFQPDPSHVAHGFEAYREAYRARLEHIRTVQGQERSRLRAWLDQALENLGPGADPRVIAAVRAEYVSTGQALDAAFRASKVAFAAARLSSHQWDSGDRPSLPTGFSLPLLLLPGPEFFERRSEAPPSFRAHHDGWRTDYMAVDGSLGFTDLRTAIIVHVPNAQTLDAALMLAAKRWGGVRVSASRANILLVAERAAALGIDLVDINGHSLSLPAARQAKPIATDHRPKVGVPRVEPKPVLGSSPEPVPDRLSSRRDAGPATLPIVTPLPTVEDEIPLHIQLAWMAGGRERSD